MKRIFLITAFLYSFYFCSFSQTAPTVQTCGPDQVFCIDQNMFDLCVNLTVTLGLPADIDYFEIDWGDNSPITTVAGSNNPADQLHTYDLSSFYFTCEYDDKYFVLLETYLVNGDILNSSFQVTFLNPPQAMFSINPSVICEGDEACFNDTPCPSENLEIISWDYGDGTTGLDDCHVYETAGTYTITLTVENPCGQSTISQTLEVIEAAEAEIVITSSNVDISAAPFIYCLGSGLVDLDGDSLSCLLYTSDAADE